MNRFFIIVPLGVIIALIGCGSKTETLVDPPPLRNYYSFKVGTSQIYRLDSTILAPSNLDFIVRSYQAKDSVESTLFDNQGRLSYRIFRLIRDLQETKSWQFAATYYATPTEKSIEYVDNNLRFIKMVSPIWNNHRFKGNSFIPNTQGTQFGYLFDWDYEYQKVGEPYKINNRTFDSTVTVLQEDFTDPPGPLDPKSYKERNYGIEVYAKGVGLIYKDFLHWAYQPATSSAPAHYEKGSYGIKLTFIR
jgi:hypothetical protein